MAIEHKTPRYYLFRSEEVRVIADCIKDDFTRETMIKIADDYERMAEMIKTIQIHRGNE